MRLSRPPILLEFCDVYLGMRRINRVTTATKNKGGNRNMNSSNTVLRWVATPLLLGCLGTASAWGQDQPNQTLDQVDAFSATKVLEMAFDRQNPPTLPDFSEPDLGSPAGIAACKLASSGLYCLATNGSPEPGCPPMGAASGCHESYASC